MVMSTVAVFRDLLLMGGMNVKDQVDSLSRGVSYHRAVT